MIKDSDVRNIAIGIFVSIIMIIAAFFHARYFNSNLEVHYSSLEARLPNNIEKDFYGRDNKPSPTTLLRCFAKNTSKDAIELYELRIYGIKDFYGMNSENPVDKKKFIDVISMQASFKKDAGTLLVSKLPSLGPEQEIAFFVWGEFPGNSYVELATSKGDFPADEALLVAGTEEFFARYWVLIITITIFSIIFIIYKYKLKSEKNEQKAPRTQTSRRKSSAKQ
jgi:hypothetical protein